jgi:hypothetical protein
MEMSSQLKAPAALPPRKEPQNQLDRGLGGPQSQSGRGGKEEKYHHCTCQELNPGRSARSLVCILLSYAGSRFNA